MTNTQPVTCPLCRRSLDGKVTRHYLYPQKYGRKKGRKTHAKEFPVVSLHKICPHDSCALQREVPGGAPQYN
jgi:hypothetical protein